MKKIYVQKNNTIYSADIDITVAEWKEMLQNKDIFYPNALQMIKYWYLQPDYMATHKVIMLKYNINLKSSPFNGIVKSLSAKIMKYLNRFEVIGTTGEKSFFCVPFEGWHEDYDTSKHFVWKLRDELIYAIDELRLFEEDVIGEESRNNELENIVEVATREGKKMGKYVTTYERSNKNRLLAIKIHGAKCAICNFDFEKSYGELGKNFIEVHHIKPLFENEEEVKINPRTDLICVCSNCHRMLHRRRNEVLSPEQLKNIMQNCVPK